MNLVPPDVGIDRDRGVRIQNADPAGRDVVAQDQLALVLPGGLLIVGIGRLEPGAREEEIQVQGIVLVRLIIEAVEDRLIVPDVVQRGKFGRIEIAAGAHAVDRNEIAPLSCRPRRT